MSHDPSAVRAASAAAPAAMGACSAPSCGARSASARGSRCSSPSSSAFIVWRDAAAPGTVDMQKMANDGFLLAFVTIVAAPAWIGVSVLAARWRGWRARDYLALVPPRRGEIVVGIACLAALLIGFDLLTLLLGRDVVPSFMVEAYKSARDRRLAGDVLSSRS